ncbi:hypothetical protein V5O48_017544 [Marasmius crinis-equi]|uniref:Heterokaryon incompatibility domain-containing protein n=1 Tax=Marasmius crinis-equi TaxID=585013 RepID=A0ABR3ENQ0_9AGAR
MTPAQPPGHAGFYGQNYNHRRLGLGDPEHVSAAEMQTRGPVAAFPQLQPPSKPLYLTIPQASQDIPPRPEFIPFTVPHLCAPNPYDGKDFWSYPERCGWNVSTRDTQCHVLCPPGMCHHGLNLDERRKVTRVPNMFSRSDGSPVVASEKAAFLQAWLFFGVLTEVSGLCGLEIDLANEFILEDGSVSTQGLNGLPGRWFEAAVARERAGDKTVMEHILTVARHSRLMLGEERDIAGGKLLFKYSYDECRVLFSLGILVRTIGLHLLLHTYMPGFTTSEEEGWGRLRVLQSLDGPLGTIYLIEGMDQLSDLARNELEAQGWCESELDLLPYEEVAFASLLSRPRIRDHSSCGDVICSAYQTDEATYQIRHVDNECSCAFVGLDPDNLTAILSRDKVPVVLITEELELKVASGDEYPYIALSHVWADGLGNPKSNALPQCQLRRLREYANNLSHIHNPEARPSSSTAALWMDTLCIPVDPSKLAYRKKAIKLLGETFHKATAVLILDRELEIVQCATATFLELGLRILCSGWVKRLWTLQEATLASEAWGTDKLYFQMQDGPFLYQKYHRNRKALRSLNEHMTEIEAEERTLLLEDGIMLELGAQIPSVQAMREMREGWSPFRVIHSATEHRSTSKFEDVPLCIASLLGKDLSSIISASDAEKRMAAFYILMREVPIGVLWCNKPAKLSTRPFRWAPKSISSCPPTTFTGWEDGICDAAGFHITVRGFRLTESEVQQHVSSSVLPHTFNIVSADTGVAFGLVRTKEGTTIPLQRIMALILKPPDRGVSPNGVVVAVEGSATSLSDKGIPSTEYVCTIIGYVDTFSKNEPGAVFLQVDTTPSNQRWCVT